MAAAYASLVSLLNTMDLIHIHPLLSTCFSNHQIKSLREKIDFFLDFLENYSVADNKKVEDLVRRIGVVAHEAENLIEVQAADQVRAASIQSSSYSSFFDNLQKMIEDMHSIKEEVIKTKEETGLFITPSSIPPSSSSSTAAKTTTTTTMVGFDGYVEKLLDQLTGHDCDWKIIPIVGMGGIGKTTLARNVYEKLYNDPYFDVCAWVTVSQQFNAIDIFSQALSCLGRISTSTTDHDDIDQLGEKLFKTLYGRRYLIVLDDVWSVQAWERIKNFFPESNNGSRIVITTRQQKLVNYFRSSAIVVDFLDYNKSWQLFCEKTFGQQGCPHPELEQVGKKIVRKCKGLPLAIDVIGGFLGKSPTQEYWEKFADRTSLVLDSGEDKEVMSILYLSYKHLPIKLKPCFLYLGIFPEDYSIDVSILIKLWIAEGFIKPNLDQSLEEVAECYIKELLDRNLLIVGGLDEYSKLTSCRVHDLVRDMCVRIAEKEDLFCVEREIGRMREYIVNTRRARYNRVISVVTAQISEGQRAKPSESRLLRVLFSFDEGVEQSLVNLREVNLRYLFYHPWSCAVYSLPSSISLLWGLQTLIIDSRSFKTFAASTEIWMMPQLRHVIMNSMYLPAPPPSDDPIVLQNLQTLQRVRNLNVNEKICKRIPNIKELVIDYDFKGAAASSCAPLQNVGCLNKLEVLGYYCSGCENLGISLQNLKLPSSLKELRLSDCMLEWSKMAVIASLPHLQILELQHKAVVGPEWNFSADREFRCLKNLCIQSCRHLRNWNADSSNFPVLETLHLEFLTKLEEIPSGIGDIPTLEIMCLDTCSESATISAVNILEEQERSGNENLHLHLNNYVEAKVAKLKEKIKQWGFTCQNLHYK